MRQGMFTLSGAPITSIISKFDNYIFSIFQYLRIPLNVDFLPYEERILIMHADFYSI